MRYLWRPFWIFAFCAFPAKNVQGCPPRLCSWLFVEMISVGQPFKAGHVSFPKISWFGSLGNGHMAFYSRWIQHFFSRN